MADAESRMKLQIQALQNELREERLRNDLKVQKVRADTDKRLLEMSAAIERETRDRETAALRATIKQQALKAEIERERRERTEQGLKAELELKLVQERAERARMEQNAERTRIEMKAQMEKRDIKGEVDKLWIEMRISRDRSTVLRQIQDLQREIALVKSHQQSHSISGLAASPYLLASQSDQTQLLGRQIVTIASPPAQNTGQIATTANATPAANEAAAPAVHEAPGLAAPAAAAAPEPVVVPAVQAKKMQSDEEQAAPASVKVRPTSLVVSSSKTPSAAELLPPPLPQGLKTHASGGNQANGLSLVQVRPYADLCCLLSCLAIYLELERMGFKVWYDNRCIRSVIRPCSHFLAQMVCCVCLGTQPPRADDLTKEGMRNGILEAAAFLLFLSGDVLMRPFCQFEIREAIAAEKVIVLVHEENPLHGAFDFAAQKQAPKDLVALLERLESLPYSRQGADRRTMWQTIIARAGFARSAGETAPLPSTETAAGDDLAMISLPHGQSCHFFICCASSGSDQANTIHLELERLGFKAHYDVGVEQSKEAIKEAGAFVLFLSAGVLVQHSCQVEIRKAVALQKTMLLCHESDPRFGAYDFYQEGDRAPSDLKELTSLFESLPFRRRGYERDSMLHALIERASYGELYLRAQQPEKHKLAPMPRELSHFDMEAFYDRPVQKELVDLLLLSKDDKRFANCVVVHGMGGSGKTVTVVAALQERAVRMHMRHIYWLVVGQEATSSKLRELQALLYAQLAGKAVQNQEREEKDEKQLLEMLVAALADKDRTLLVLDDPWVPEQVQFLNPVELDSDHKLLVTTRIRDLVPMATTLDLSVVEKEEAVELLLSVAGIERDKYSGEKWPPQAALDIALECKLLPITLKIAATMVRSWGPGWQEAVPALLKRSALGDASSRAVEERVIGAGLQTLEKGGDGAALKELFYMFAVTREDVVHPMAVIELLWRACCHQTVETQDDAAKLQSRLKLRQRITLLVDRSLLLGSSTSGVHVHDLVLDFVQRAKDVTELQGLHRLVVKEIATASVERQRVTGQGLQVDWYACQCTDFHIRKTNLPIEDPDIKTWLLLDDDVIPRHVVRVFGQEAVEKLAATYQEQSQLYEAAKAKKAAALATDSSLWAGSRPALLQEAAALLEKVDTTEAKQLEYEIRTGLKWTWERGSKEQLYTEKRQQELADSGAVKMDPNAKAVEAWNDLALLTFGYPALWDSGGRPTQDTVDEAVEGWCREFDKTISTKLVERAVGTRKEAFTIQALNLAAFTCMPLQKSARVVGVYHAYLTKHFGEGSAEYVKAYLGYDVDRHLRANCRDGLGIDLVSCPSPQAVAEHGGNITGASKYMKKYLDICLKVDRVDPSNIILLTSYQAFAHLLEAKRFAPEYLQHFKAGGLEDIDQCEEFISTHPACNVIHSMKSSSADGSHHMHCPQTWLHKVTSVYASVSAESSSKWMDGLPPANAPIYHDCFLMTFQPIGARPLIAEAFERQGRYDEAIQFATAEIGNPDIFNAPTKGRAGLVLGRAHAAHGQHALCASALDAVIELAKSSRLLFSEGLAVGSRARLGKAAAAAGQEGGVHWGEQTCEQRLEEVMARMGEGREPIRALLLGC